VAKWHNLNPHSVLVGWQQREVLCVLYFPFNSFYFLKLFLNSLIETIHFQRPDLRFSNEDVEPIPLNPSLGYFESKYQKNINTRTKKKKKHILLIKYY
jgi:hypothetical protein